MYGKSNKKLLSNEKLRLLLKCKKHLSQQQIGAKNHTIKTSFFEKNEIFIQSPSRSRYFEETVRS